MAIHCEVKACRIKKPLNSREKAVLMSKSSNPSLEIPPGPQDGDQLRPHFVSADTVNLLSTRRSTVAKDMSEPGPSDEELARLLRIAARVPDHGKLAPWRFLIFQGSARAEFGHRLAEIFSKGEPAADEARIQFERDRFNRAPAIVAVISKTQPHPKAPEWEQILSAGAVCQNMLIGASALGYAAQWITEWYGYDPAVHKVLGLEDGERVAGFLYIGSTDCQLTERRRPPLEPRISVWQPRD